MVMRLLDRVRRRLPLGEEEAAILLRAFDYEPARTAAERQGQIEDIITTDDGLKYAALNYGKSQRTIRRWCENDLFPSARKTAGGHWRIPFDAIEEAEQHMPSGFTRKPKTIFGTKDWAELKADLKKFFRVIPTSIETDAGMRDVDSIELRSKRPPKIAPESFKALLRAIKGGVEPYLRLRLAARRIYAGNPDRRITTLMLANELGISLAGLYRHYGAVKIQRAIKEAQRPLKSGAAEQQEDAFPNEVAEMFAKLVGFNDYGKKSDDDEDKGDEIAKPTPKRRKSA